MELNGSKVLVFTGTVPIETSFVASKEAPKGTATINGKLKYQACNEHMCFAPKVLEVHFTAVIE